jgi:hypothetical protein
MSEMTINEAMRLALAKASHSDRSKLKIRGAKAVVIALATPFIGLIFLAVLPFVGLACCAWHGLNAIAEPSDRGAKFRAAKNAPRSLGSLRAWVTTALLPRLLEPPETYLFKS